MVTCKQSALSPLQKDRWKGIRCYLPTGKGKKQQELGIKETEEKPGSFVFGMEMLNAAFPFSVERYIGMGSGLRLGHLLLAHEEAEALELGSAPSHSILLGFLPQSGAVRAQFQCFSHLSSLHCKYISNVESGICLSFSSFISVHF